MFYLGNRSGLRTGELAGLRMSDLDYLKDGASGSILLRRAAQRGQALHWQMKWAPAPEDYDEILGPWLKRRLLQAHNRRTSCFPAPPSEIAHVGSAGTATERSLEPAGRGQDDTQQEVRRGKPGWREVEMNLVPGHPAPATSREARRRSVTRRGECVRGHSSPAVTNDTTTTTSGRSSRPYSRAVWKK